MVEECLMWSDVELLPELNLLLDWLILRRFPETPEVWREVVNREGGDGSCDAEHVHVGPNDSQKSRLHYDEPCPK